MIQFIRGELVSVEEDRILVDVGGVGYGIFMPAQSMNRLPKTGSEVKIYTYLNVKEDAMQLFGFLTRDDLQVFKPLIGVSGIGPKGGQGTSEYDYRKVSGRTGGTGNAGCFCGRGCGNH